MQGDPRNSQWRGPAPIMNGLALALLALCAFLRVYRLGSLPGINGDEAWLGWTVRGWAAGQAVSLQTPTGNFINPLFLLTEWPLLAWFGPGMALLRWPAALWNLAGIVMFWLLYRRALGDAHEALLVTLTAACLPLHLCHSRMGWDPAFILVVAPVVLCAALAVAERGWNARRGMLLAAAALLALWVHMTMIVFVALAGAGLWAAGARRAWAEPPGAERHRALRRSGLRAVAAALVLAGIGLALAGLANRSAGSLAGEVGQGAQEAATRLDILVAELRHVSVVLSGARAFEYFAGRPLGGAALAWSALCLAAFVGAAAILLRAPRRPADGCLGAIALAAVPAIVALRGLYHLERPGSERYVLWLAPLFAMVLGRVAARVRGRAGWWAMAGLLALAAANLAAAGRGYFLAAARLEYRATQPRTFWTGPEEPKAAAARLISAVAARQGVAGVWAEDWWLCYPLRFLLGESPAVHDMMMKKPPANLPAEGAIVLVGWPNGPFIAPLLRHYAARGARMERIDVNGGDGQPVLTVIIVHAAPPASP